MAGLTQYMSVPTFNLSGDAAGADVVISINQTRFSVYYLKVQETLHISRRLV